MKKLIAIAVMIALVAGAVFAETAVTGSVDVRWGIQAGGGNDASIGTQIRAVEGVMQMQNTNDEGNFGGMLRMKIDDNHDLSASKASGFDVIEAWWKPIDQLRIYLGQNGDGFWETGKLTSWAYNQGGEGWITTHDWWFWRQVFPGNVDGYVLAFNFYLVEGLDLNLGIHAGNGAMLADLPGYLHLNMGYKIEGVGQILFDWWGPGTNMSDAKKYGRLGASFYSGDLVDGLEFQVGVSTDLGEGYYGGVSGGSNPISIGAAVAYVGGEWGVKFRSAFVLNGNNPTTYAKDVKTIYASVMPWYDMGNMKINVDIGMLMGNGTADTIGDMGFWLNPYLTVPGGAGKFQVGMKIFSGVRNSNWQWVDATAITKDDKVKISIPMRFVFSF